MTPIIETSKGGPKLDAFDLVFQPKEESVASRTTLAQHALCCYELAQATPGTDAKDETKPPQDVDVPKDTSKPGSDDAAKTGTDAAAKPRLRLDDNDFDIAKPLSNYKTVDDNVSRSGRPLVDKGGLDEIMEKLHPGQTKTYQKDHTAIIELRDEDQQMDKPEITALNKGEVLGEETHCKTSTPPIEYHRFKMISKEFQSPEKIDKVVEAIEQAVANGKKVSLHCFHGSDRSGLISAAYLLNSDPNFVKELKADPDKAYKMASKYMVENGCEPASYTAMFQSLKQYCDWKHDQLNGGSKQVDGKNPVAVTAVPLDAALTQKVDDLADKMYKDTRFNSDPVAVYRDTLTGLADNIDPATNQAFYKALRQKYIDGPPAEKKQKTGMYRLPNVSVVAA